MCHTAIDSKLDGASNRHPNQLLKHGPECDPRHRQLDLQVLRQEGRGHEYGALVQADEQERVQSHLAKLYSALLDARWQDSRRNGPRPDYYLLSNWRSAPAPV